MKNELSVVLSEMDTSSLYRDYYEGNTTKRTAKIKYILDGEAGPHLWIANNGLGNWKKIIYLSGWEVESLRVFLNDSKEKFISSLNKNENHKSSKSPRRIDEGV